MHYFNGLVRWACAVWYCSICSASSIVYRRHCQAHHFVRGGRGKRGRIANFLENRCLALGLSNSGSHWFFFLLFFSLLKRKLSTSTTTAKRPTAIKKSPGSHSTVVPHSQQGFAVAPVNSVGFVACASDYRHRLSLCQDASFYILSLFLHPRGYENVGDT
jgi:hypothetical protein